jgi:RNA polymerase sigma factor (sigma-70 family)
MVSVSISIHQAEAQSAAQKVAQAAAQTAAQKENTNKKINQASASISIDITLDDLLKAIGKVTKLEKTPTVKMLRENVPVMVNTEDCVAYKNGYASYDNGSGRTVVFLPDCREHTYYFTPLRENEKQYQKQNNTEDAFGALPWYFAVITQGGFQIEENSMNRKGDRKGTKAEEEKEDVASSCASYRFPNPEEEYIRMESIEEELSKLTCQQRKIYLLYHLFGYNQAEIGEILDISRDSVKTHLKRAEAKIDHKNLF